MKQGLLMVLLGVLVCLCQGTSMAGTPEISDFSDNTVRYESAAFIDDDILLTGGDDYRDGFIRFTVSPDSDVHTLSFQSDPDRDAEGALSLEDGLLYLGNGSGRELIGTVDEIQNGEQGAPLTLRFCHAPPNGSFERGNTEGWALYEWPYPTPLSGEQTDYVFDQGSTTGTGTVLLPGTQTSWFRFTNPAYSLRVTRFNALLGQYTLLLRNRGRLNGTPAYDNQPDGNGSMLGPYVVSDAFNARQGDIIAFDWSAMYCRDAYEVFGFLIHESDGTRTKIMSQRGDWQEWTTAAALIPRDGSYRFEFVCGSYDKTGNLIVGATVFMDNLRIIPHRVLDDELVSAVARHVTYMNSNLDGQGETLSVTMAVETLDNKTASATASLFLVRDQGSGPQVVVNNVLIVPFKGRAAITTQNLSATDPDTDDEDLMFRLVSGPSQGQIEDTRDPDTALVSFSQADLAEGRISYTHTGQEPGEDHFAFVVDDGTNVQISQTFSIAITPAQTALVTTSPAGGITTGSIITGGNIENDGGSPVTARGICWAKTPEPGLSGHYTEDGDGTGGFTSEITGLEPGTTYHIRAYATNEAGTAYGSEITVTTLPAAPVTAEATHITTTGFTAAWAESAGAAGYQLDVSPVPDFSFFENGYENKPVSGLSEDVQGLVPGRTYYYRVRSENVSGTGPWSQAASVTLDGTAWIGDSGDWDDAANWSRATVPGDGDDVYIGSGQAPGDVTIFITKPVILNSLTLSGSFEGTLNGETGSLGIQGDLTLSGGTLIAPAGTLTVNGDILVDGGEFAHNGGTVILDGTGQEISGEITFFNLVKHTDQPDTLTFTPGTHMTVTGDLDLAYTGTDEGSSLALTCSETGEVPVLEPLGPVTMENVTVSECLVLIPAVELSLSLSPPQLAEGESFDILAHLNIPASQDLTLDLDWSGTAQQGEDYTLNPATLTIPAGSLTATITLNVTDDGPDGEEDETITVAPVDTADYNLRGEPSLTAIITMHALPRVSTVPVDPYSEAVKPWSIDMTGSIDFQGSSSVVEAGFCWGTQASPTIEGGHVVADLQNGFKATIDGLVPGMTYSVRAYAVNDSGVAYGGDVMIQTRGTSLTGASWSAPESWSTGNVPGPDDDVYVSLNTDLGSMGASIDIDVNVSSITIADTFEGSLILSQGRTLATGAYIQDAGTVDCSLGAVDINGDFILNGGVFIAPVQAMTVQSDFILNGGTFTANGGTVVLDGSGQTVTGNTVFHNLTKLSSEEDILTFGPDTSTYISGSLTLEGPDDGSSLSVTCSDTGTTIIIENNAQMQNTEIDGCIQLVYKQAAKDDDENDGNLPVATLSHTPPSLTRALSYEIIVGGLGVTHYKYNLDGQGWTGIAPVSVPITFTLINDGTHSLSVLGRDIDENLQDEDEPTTIIWEVDITAPVARVSGCPEGTVGISDLTLTVSGQDEPITFYRYSVNGGAWSNPVQEAAPIVLTGLTGGDHSLSVIAADRVGNWQKAADATQNSWTFDINALSVVLTGVPSDPSPLSHATITVGGENVAAYLYSLDGADWTQAAVAEAIALSSLDNGRHTLRVSGLATTDTAVGEPDGFQSVSWSVDTLFPDAPTCYAAKGIPPTTTADLSWTWSSEDAEEILSHYRVFMANRAITQANLSEAVELPCHLIPGIPGMTEKMTVTGLTPATVYHFVVRSVDRAGNESELSNDVALTTSSTFPTVTSVAFSGGGTTADNAGATDLTLIGTNFIAIPGGNKIRFENDPVVFDIINTTATETKLTATLPAGAPPGTYDIRVINTNGTSLKLKDAVTITQTAATIPVVTQVLPSVVAKGETVNLTITGQNFSNPVTAVRFLLTGAASLTTDTVTRLSATTLTVTLEVPGDAVEGYYTVVVENSNGLTNGISGVNLRVVKADDLDTAGGAVISDGIVTVTGGNVPGNLTLVTDDRLGTDAQSSYPLSISIFIPAGAVIEELRDGAWMPYTGPITAPAQIPLADIVASQLGSFALQFIMGAENPLRIADGTPFMVTIQVTVPSIAPVPSLFTVGTDGSISLSGDSGTEDDVDYVAGGTVLTVREDMPEDDMTTYTLGVMLMIMDNNYALGGGVKGKSKDFGLCFIGTLAQSKITAESILCIGLLFTVFALLAFKCKNALRILSAVLILAGVTEARAELSRQGTWYILAGGGLQQIDEDNSALYFGVDQSLDVDNDVYPVIRAGYNINHTLAIEAGFRYDMYSGAMQAAQAQGDDNLTGFSLLLGPVYRLRALELPWIGKIQPFLKGDIGYRSLDDGLAYTIKSYDPAVGFEAAVGVEKGPFDFRLGYAYYTFDRKDGVPGFNPSGSNDDLNLSGPFAEVTYRFSFGKGKPLPARPLPNDKDSDGVKDVMDQCPDTLSGVRVDDRGCPFDDDKDGVINEKDTCPGTPLNIDVNLEGCPLDSDDDGVTDDKDICPDTPNTTMMVDDKGCPMDNDGDGITDDLDACPDTPQGATVDSRGCSGDGPSEDSDGDGVTDPADQCPDTPADVSVGSDGCPADKDQDGVMNSMDECPNTPPGANVDERGCWPLRGVTFDTGSAKIDSGIFEGLKSVVEVLRENPDVKLEIQGHTDSQGDAGFNLKLSDERARTIKDYLVKYHIDEKRLSAKGYGENQPAASNETVEGRAKNRRVEFMPMSH